jgi:hypothetical protein
MTREQYEDQKRRLAEQHRSLVEIVDSAYQSQLRALEMVWRMLSGEGGGEVRPAPAPAAAPPQPVAPAPPPRQRRKAGELEEEVLGVFLQLPEIFDFTDVCRLLGYTPDRGSLYRVLQELLQSGELSLVSRGSGIRPARYRRELTDDDEADA